MSLSVDSPLLDVEFIRLFFHTLVQEEIAFRWANRLQKLIGPRVLELRPTTTLAEILEWAAVRKVDTMDFVVVFEPELRRAFSAFLEDAEDTTFREMVEHVAQWYQ
jgi:hypothetical protein